MSTDAELDGRQPVPASAEITFQDIRERAYELWERHHRPSGFEVELWLMAERELKAAREKPRPGDEDRMRVRPPEQPGRVTAENTAAASGRER